MTRGQQKIQAQGKAAERDARAKKKHGHNSKEQKVAAQKALGYICAICKAQMPDTKTYRQHFENKHPKHALPAELDAGDCGGLKI